MWARKRIDISWPDLACAAGFLFRSPASSKTPDHANLHADSICCLSVRTAFDLWLSALEFPPGSEVLFSAITIRDMVRIAEHHGLVAVPVDFTASMRLDIDAMEKSITPRTRVIVIAHLFGSVVPQDQMEEVSSLANRHNLLVFEDCAQAFQGIRYAGHDESDAVAFSFGPIKTATALGGGLLHVRDSELRERIESIHDRYPAQRRSAFAARVTKYSFLKLLACRPVFSLLYFIWNRLGMTVDEQLAGLARNFPGEDFVQRLRQRPCSPLRRMIHRRVARFDPTHQVDQTALAFELAQRIRNPALLACCEQQLRTFWVVAIRSENPDSLVAAMRDEGFDATRRSSLAVVQAPPDHRPASCAKSILTELVFLPLYAQMPRREVSRMANIVRQVESLPIEATLKPHLRPRESSESVAGASERAATR